MTEIDVKTMIDEYARDKKAKLSKLKKAIDNELERLLKESIKDESNS